jgi:hypothetical protein
MSTRHDMHPFQPSGQRRELVRLVPGIQALTLELRGLGKREQTTPELDAKQRPLEQLRWRPAALARRTATDWRAAA